MKPISLFLILSLYFSLFINAQNTTIIHAGTLLANPGNKAETNKSIIVKDGIIKDVKDGFINASDLKLSDSTVTIINLKNKFVLPGFIDLHTHITQERNPNSNPHEWTTLNDEDLAFRTIPFLNKTLMAGFTTVRNLGADYQLINSIKRSITRGDINGPRIIAATGAVSATGGHGDAHGYRPEILNAFEKRVGVCDGADDCRRAVRELVKQGADVIKITATGGVLSNTAAGVGQQLTDDELKAIVETANSLGRKVAAHAHEADGINAALKAGVNSIEHGSYLNDESVTLFNKTGAYLVPTLLAGVSVTEELKVNKNIPPAIADKIRQVGPVVEASFKRALKGSVKIAFGTDSGVSVHGTNAREFELMVKYGMDENEAIKSATITASELLGMSDKLGTITTGKIADIIAVDKNPLTNISSLLNVGFVMKEGKVFKK
ncbi:amidohydrolase family protein [uncultured Wocania sp.]|uniref:metal-dependent hydrolase family protein n=1 Tax=uncultured Wocania sp. TaxID=2834404 RepID=UPI0030FBF485